MSKHIIKREGHEEHYDERKVYASCYAACLNVRLANKEEAEKICEAVTAEINEWIDTKDEVNSDELFARVTNALKKQNPDAAYMYETHRDIF